MEVISPAPAPEPESKPKSKSKPPQKSHSTPPKPQGTLKSESPKSSVANDNNEMSDALQRIQHLTTLYDSDLITHEDYETRKSQIVDELTRTSSLYHTHTRKGSRSHLNNYVTQESSDTNLQNSGNHNSSKNKVFTNNPPIQTPANNVLQHNKSPSKKITIQVVKHDPPDWTEIRAEKAEKWIYDYDEEKWQIEQCKVKIDEVPFDKGGLRYVFHLLDVSNGHGHGNGNGNGNPSIKWVAKMSQDLRDSIKREIYFNDVRMQAIARHFCDGPTGYNTYNVPKRVQFLNAFVLHLKQREGSPVCHVEQFIEGEYIKYNNNVGWVSDHHRNTPQAFAHFTYEASRKKLLVCDIQGVNDVYTDPQVHSSENQKAFGRGNLGQRGFENFLRTHRCNPICKYLNLENINQLPIQVMGTVPAQTQIAQGCISTVPFDFDKSGNVPLLSDKGFPQRIVEEHIVTDDVGKDAGKGDKNSNNDSGANTTNNKDHEKQCCACVIL